VTKINMGAQHSRKGERERRQDVGGYHTRVELVKEREVRGNNYYEGG
jgi:hypothetical protein